jgi:hypothetical protein
VAHSIARDLQKALVRNSVAAKYLDRLKSTILKHFDVAAYEGKPVNATLLVALVNGAQEKGYQAMLDASEAEAHELATVYGQLTCRRLCEELQQMLPRELRDRVYEQLMEEYMVVDSVEQSDCFQCEDGEDCRIHTHLRSVDYLGIETQTEIAEFWYHISSFYLHDPCDLEFHLQKYKTFKVSFLPNPLIRHVWFTIEIEDYLHRLDIGTDPVYMRDEHQKSLSNLTSLKAGAEIGVQLSSCTAVTENELVEILDPVFVVLTNLVRSGYCVTVCKWGVWLGHVTTITNASTGKEWVESQMAWR